MRVDGVWLSGRPVRGFSGGPVRGLCGAVLAAAVVLTGCGGGTTARPLPPVPPSPTSATQKSPQLVLREAHDAFVAAPGVRVKGSVPGMAGSVAVDLHLVKGKGAVGTFTVPKGKVDFLRLGSTAYLRGSDEFLRDTLGDPSLAAAAKGKWVKGPVTKLAPGLAELTDQSAFAGAFDAAGNVTADGTEKVGGTTAVRLRSSKGPVLLVAATGTPYPLRITRQVNGKAASLDFTEYGKVSKLTAPKDAITLQA